MASSSTTETPGDVLLFYPNIIGYMRILFTCLSVYYALEDWRTSMTCYLLSFCCDYFDGLVARACNQCSNFGAVLDMVTDRCSTACLLMVLGHLYAKEGHGGLALLFFSLLMTLDIFSHWLHMYASAKLREHHKTTDTSQGWILRAYYGCKPLFGYCCVGAELFYVLLYIRMFIADDTVVVSAGGFDVTLWQLCFYGMGPACAIKQITNVAQLFAGATELAEADVRNRAAARSKGN
eukprot:g2585.t1